MTRGFGLPIQMLNGFGCAGCGGGCTSTKPMQGFSFMSGTDDVADIIKIGGNSYYADNILDKTVVARVETKVFSNPSPGAKLLATIAAGQPIGKVNSYLKPTDAGTYGKSWLEFKLYSGVYGYVPNENVSATGVKDQGTKTVKEETQDKQDEALKDSSPVEYYIKKYAGKVILIAVGTIVLVSFGKEAIKGAIAKKKAPEEKPAPTEPALGSVKKKRKKKKSKK